MTDEPSRGRGAPRPAPLARPDRAELFARESRPFFRVDGVGAGDGHVRESGTRTVLGDDGCERWEVASIGVEHRSSDGVLLVLTRFDRGRDIADEHLRRDMAGRLGLAAAEPYEGEAYVDGPEMWARVEVATKEADRWAPADLKLDGVAVAGLGGQAGRYRLTYAVARPDCVVAVLERAWRGPRALVSSRDWGGLTSVPSTWT